MISQRVTHDQSTSKLDSSYSETSLQAVCLEFVITLRLISQYNFKINRMVDQLSAHFNV